MTPLAKTLKEDPSCQICTVLQKYYLQSDAVTIESNLRENDLPQLFTLRQVWSLNIFKLCLSTFFDYKFLRVTFC